MFLIDVVNFIVTIYGYWAFGVRPYPVSDQPKNMTPNALWRHKPHHLCLSAEVLCGGRHHRVSVRGPGSRGLPGHAAHPVWHHDSGPGPLPEEVPAGKVCFPGGAGVWHTLLDVLHSPRGHREVINLIYHIADGLYCLERWLKKTTNYWSHSILYATMCRIRIFWIKTGSRKERTRKKSFFCCRYFLFRCFRSTGGSTGTLWLSSGTLWSVSTLACRPTRSNVDTRTVSWATFSPRTTTTWTSSSSKGECMHLNESSIAPSKGMNWKNSFPPSSLSPSPAFVWFPSWQSWGRWWTGFGPTPLCHCPTGFA